MITGANKSIALYKAIEEGVCHMWTVSAFQMHNNTLMVCDEDATLELRVRTVKYFKVGVEKCANMCVSVLYKTVSFYHFRTCGMFTQVSMRRFLRKN